MTKTKTTKIEVPFLLSWDAERRMVPGRGEAGWTVMAFDSLDDAHAWAAKNQASSMPCWRRAALWGGRELGR